MSAPSLVFDDKERVGAWVADQVEQTSSWGDFYAMGAEANGEIVSGVVFNNFNESNSTCHIAVSKPNRLFLELLDHAYSYAFGQCKLKRLTGLVAADNHKALKLDKHIGFVEEGVMAKAGRQGQDIITLVLWPENYYKGQTHGF
jgi:RimJ/RimL family protein N-acetyltransferase